MSQRYASFPPVFVIRIVIPHIRRLTHTCVQHANPLFRPGSDAATPGSMRRPDYPPAMQHAMHLPSRVQMYSDPHVTLPDAGNLFSPMPTVVADAAPAHLQDIVRARAMPAWNVERPFLTGALFSVAFFH